MPKHQNPQVRDQYWIKRRLAFIAQGLCGHGCRKPINKKRSDTLCTDCLDDNVRRRQDWWDKNKEVARIRHAAQHKERRLKLRSEIIEAYGGKCVCCGESEFWFLQLDHIYGNGNAHRKQIGCHKNGWTGRGGHFDIWVKNNGFPDFLQLLCANCNWGKSRNGGICPHVTKAQATAQTTQ